MRCFLGLLAVFAVLFFSAPAWARMAATAVPVVQDDLAAEEEKEEIVDTPISYDMPFYAKEDAVVMGKVRTHITGEEDTLMDIARAYGLGYVALRAANSGVDAWAPLPGREMTIPAMRILPRAPQQGIVINLGEMRLFYFAGDGSVESFPIGIGREGLQTPTGTTKIIKKIVKPSWYPTDRMREEKPGLPERVRSGPSNPLGDYALYLGWPTFLIHGTNKPWGIGRRVSSGCIRMYPEDIKLLYARAMVDTKVTVVDQPVKLAFLEDGLYMQAHPTRTQSDALESDGLIPAELTDKEIPEELKTFIGKIITQHGGYDQEALDWDKVLEVLKARSGIPVKILGGQT
ncbi:MAG: L,D-transpeptidase [Alphaproteobacteria bacterium]|nr:MAG: L,D-transpeptidase [Alphaproteobacteria bacterium]